MMMMMMSEQHLARPFQRYVVCRYRKTLFLLGGDLRFCRHMNIQTRCGNRMQSDMVIRRTTVGSFLVVPVDMQRMTLISHGISLFTLRVWNRLQRIADKLARQKHNIITTKLNHNNHKHSHQNNKSSLFDSTSVRLHPEMLVKRVVTNNSVT